MQSAAARRNGTGRAKRRTERAHRARAERIARAIGGVLYVGAAGALCFRQRDIERIALRFNTQAEIVRNIAIPLRDLRRAEAKAAAEKEAA